MESSLELQTLDWLRIRDGMSDEQIASDYYEHHLSIIKKREALTRSGLRVSFRTVAPNYEYLPERVKQCVSVLINKESKPSLQINPEAIEGIPNGSEFSAEVRIRVLSASGVGELNRRVSASLLEFWATEEPLGGLNRRYLHAFMPDEDHTNEVVLVPKLVWDDIFQRLESFADDSDAVYEIKLHEFIDSAKISTAYKLLTLSK